MSVISTDVVYHVLAPTRSVSAVYDILEKFLPERLPLNLDYANHLNGGYFESEKEMIEHFIEENHSGQTFYWNAKRPDPNAPMVGIDLTSDRKMIVTVTIKSTEMEIERFFLEMKSFLKSDVGVISYQCLSEYVDGRDFERKFGMEHSL